jgi:hypothetical protein
LQATSPQAADGLQYGFGSWTGGGSSSGSATLTVTAPLLPTVFNAGFKILPLITWPAPAAIKFGSALSGTQLNATANIPGTFVYNPPAGTVLPVGAGHPLSATFTPLDTTVYATVTASNSITITPASSGPVNLIVTNVLRRSDGNVVAQITIANTGGTDATNVVLTNAKVGAVTATPLPQTIGTIAAGASAQIMVSVPGSVGSSGAASSLVVNGTYTGGVFSSSARVTLP